MCWAEVILANYPDRGDVFREYPFLEEEDLRQPLGYAATAVDDDVHHFRVA